MLVTNKHLIATTLHTNSQHNWIQALAVSKVCRGHSKELYCSAKNIKKVILHKMSDKTSIFCSLTRGTIL